jgi:hypothetical protein
VHGGHHADLSDFPEFHSALKQALAAFPYDPDQAGKVRSAS